MEKNGDQSNNQGTVRDSHPKFSIGKRVDGMPKKTKTGSAAPPASVVVTGVPGPGGAPSVLNGVYLLEGQENGRARWKRSYSDAEGEGGDLFVFFGGSAWCVGNLEDTPCVESSNTNPWGHPLGLSWVVAGSSGTEVAVLEGKADEGGKAMEGKEDPAAPRKTPARLTLALPVSQDNLDRLHTVLGATATTPSRIDVYGLHPGKAAALAGDVSTTVIVGVPSYYAKRGLLHSPSSFFANGLDMEYLAAQLAAAYNTHAVVSRSNAHGVIITLAGTLAGEVKEYFHDHYIAGLVDMKAHSAELQGYVRAARVDVPVDVLGRELDSLTADVTALFEGERGSTRIRIVGASRTFVQFEFRRTPWKTLSCRISLPAAAAGYPALGAAVVEVKSASPLIGPGVVRKLSALCEAEVETRRAAGEGQIMPVVRILHTFLDTNRLVLVVREMKQAQKQMAGGGGGGGGGGGSGGGSGGSGEDSKPPSLTAMRPNAGAGTVRLTMKEQAYGATVTLTVPDNYPREPVAVDVSSTTFAPNIIHVFAAQATEMARRCGEGHAPSEAGALKGTMRQPPKDKVKVVPRITNKSMANLKHDGEDGVGGGGEWGGSEEGAEERESRPSD